MKVTINGEPKEFCDSLSLMNLLESLGLGKKPVVVELNKEAIFPRNFENTTINDGDKVEIITIAAGG